MAFFLSSGGRYSGPRRQDGLSPSAHRRAALACQTLRISGRAALDCHQAAYKKGGKLCRQAMPTRRWGNVDWFRSRARPTRAFFPRRTGLRVLPCAGCKAEESSPRSRLKAKRLRHMSKKNKVPWLIAYSLVLMSLCSRPSSLFLNGSALRRACSSGFQPHRSQKSGASFAYWQAFPPFGRPHPACGLLSFFFFRHV